LDVVLALENVTPLPEGSEHYLLGDNIYDFEFIYSELNSNNLKFCLDTGHANIAEGVDKYLDHFSNKIIAVHYHDNLGNDDAHLAVGKGNIDWIDFSNKITNLNFTGPFISECRNIKPHEAANSLIKYFLKTTTLLR
jgi:sugar phosphate isomerase/epimerase